MNKRRCIHVGDLPNYACLVLNKLPSQYSHLIRDLFPVLLNYHSKCVTDELELYVGDDTYPFIDLIYEVCPFVKTCSMVKDANSIPFNVFTNQIFIYKFREYMLNKYLIHTDSSSNSNLNRVVFIKRGGSQHSDRDTHPHGSSRRHIVNEDECIEMLYRWCAERGYTFNAVELETLDIHYQIRLFSEATMIVAQHGAGLVNTIFDTKKSLVVELYSPPHRNWFKMCYSIVGKWIQIEHNDQFITVDLDNMEKVINTHYVRRICA